MTVPDVITRYYAASGSGDLTHSSHASRYASVANQTEKFTGQAEIRAWRETLAAPFTYTTEVTSVEQSGGEYVVETYVVGNFPGGVVHLTNPFTVADEVITSVVI
jgi:hypothetical protein